MRKNGFSSMVLSKKNHAFLTNGTATCENKIGKAYQKRIKQMAGIFHMYEKCQPSVLYRKQKGATV